jgi:cytosine/creatinine deaminase
MPTSERCHATDGLRVARARVPLCLLEGDFPDAGEGLALVDIDVANGAIAGIAPAGTGAKPREAGVIDQNGGQVWPGLVDLHTHLDKGHIWPRAENPDGTFGAALEASRADRLGRWSTEDVPADRRHAARLPRARHPVLMWLRHQAGYDPQLFMASLVSEHIAHPCAPGRDHPHALRIRKKNSPACSRLSRSS